MRRPVLLGTAVAAGFAGGWLVFEQPFRDSPTAAEIERRVVIEEGARLHQPESALCRPQRAGSSSWSCVVLYRAPDDPAQNLVVRPDGSDGLDYLQRRIFEYLDEP